VGREGGDDAEMTDIVERLRGIVAEREARGRGATTTIDPNITGWLNEAADEIEQLRAGVELWKCRVNEGADIIEGNVAIIDELRAANKRLQDAMIEVAEL
jgi:hypothetical protein